MSIQSNVFWMFFLPLSLLVYYRVKDRYKPSVLLIFSIVFHLCVSILHLLVFLVLSAVNIALGQKLSAMKSGERRRKPLFITGVVLNAAVLVFYKYSGFLNDRLPDGSFAGLLVFPYRRPA